jgi:hypothetical protein
MSDELRKDEETEVEGHLRKPLANDQPAEDDEDEVEAHLRRHGNVRMDSPRST